MYAGITQSANVLRTIGVLVRTNKSMQNEEGIFNFIVTQLLFLLSFS